jgi:hypothetical protein
MEWFLIRAAVVAIGLWLASKMGLVVRLDRHADRRGAPA